MFEMFNKKARDIKAYEMAEYALNTLMYMETPVRFEKHDRLINKHCACSTRSFYIKDKSYIQGDEDFFYESKRLHGFGTTQIRAAAEIGKWLTKIIKDGNIIIVPPPLKIDGTTKVYQFQDDGTIMLTHTKKSGESYIAVADDNKTGFNAERSRKKAQEILGPHPQSGLIEPPRPWPHN